MNSVSGIKYMLLCFCDASTRQSNEYESKVSLLFTKTRLTPVKGMAVPRAELMAVLMA